MNINDLSDNLGANPKLFAEDTSLFSVIPENDLSTKNLNDNLNGQITRFFQWKMSFDKDFNNQAEEFFFFGKFENQSASFSF